jgi:hypothetical protein
MFPSLITDEIAEEINLCETFLEAANLVLIKEGFIK